MKRSLSENMESLDFSLKATSAAKIHFFIETTKNFLDFLKKIRKERNKERERERIELSQVSPHTPRTNGHRPKGKGRSSYPRAITLGKPATKRIERAC